MEKPYRIMVGDNRVSLRELAENSVDAIVTDPPYELGFMGKGWDRTGIANDVKFWDDCLRVLKPGGHLLAFSGSRTYHRMTCAIEDAGFEVRDQIMWVYGSGFPKSLDVAKAFDKKNGYLKNEGKGMLSKETGRMTLVPHTKSSEYKRPEMKSEAAKQWDGWGTALKPAHEPICVARKPLEGTVADNVMKWGTGAINVDACRVGTDGNRPLRVLDAKQTENNAYEGRMDGSMAGGSKAVGETTQGRWPANLIHDGSEEVLELFPETGPSKASKRGAPPHYNGQVMKDLAERGHDDNGGSAARFFYCPKASKKDRDEGCEGMPKVRESDREKSDGVGGDNPRNRTNAARVNHHPTVKPTDLMAYLCRLVTPPGGLILDPFMGSGSTGKAAIREGFRFVGMELSPEYAAIAEARIAAELAKRK